MHLREFEDTVNSNIVHSIMFAACVFPSDLPYDKYLPYDVFNRYKMIRVTQV